MDETDYTERTCIIVVEIDSCSGRIHIGIIVDSVSEVINIKGHEIEDTPSFGDTSDTDYILGVAKTAGKVTILLDIDKSMCTDQFLISSAA
jgi:purine-binding chemotaxis protein CheW